MDLCRKYLPYFDCGRTPGRRLEFVEFAGSTGADVGGEDPPASKGSCHRLRQALEQPSIPSTSLHDYWWYFERLQYRQGRRPSSWSPRNEMWPIRYSPRAAFIPNRIVNQLLTGQEFDLNCHSNLTRAILPYHLTEFDVHDVLNVVCGWSYSCRLMVVSMHRTE